MERPDESHVIASRLAASPWFPIPAAVDGVRDSTAHIEVIGSAVLITVTDPDGIKREYQAQVVLVSDSNTAPVAPVREHRAGAVLNNPSPRKDVRP